MPPIKILERRNDGSTTAAIQPIFYQGDARLNPIQEAVRRAGGPSRVAAELRVSSRAVNSWQNKGYVPKLDYAARLAELAEMPVNVLRKPL